MRLGKKFERAWMRTQDLEILFDFFTVPLPLALCLPIDGVANNVVILLIIINTTWRH